MFNTQQMGLQLLSYILVSALWKLQLRWDILKFNIKKAYVYIEQFLTINMLIDLVVPKKKKWFVPTLYNFNNEA